MRSGKDTTPGLETGAGMKFAWMNPCEKMQPIIQKNQTQMLSDLFQDDSEHPSCETIICLLTRRVE